MLNVTNVSRISSWFPKSPHLTCPDDKLGHISVGSQDLANENQDDTYNMCFAVRHCGNGTFTTKFLKSAPWTTRLDHLNNHDDDRDDGHINHTIFDTNTTNVSKPPWQQQPAAVNLRDDGGKWPQHCRGSRLVGLEPRYCMLSHLYSLIHTTNIYLPGDYVMTMNGHSCPSTHLGWQTANANNDRQLQTRRPRYM